MSFGEFAPRGQGGRKPLSETQNSARGVTQSVGTNNIVLGSGSVAVGDGSIVVGVNANAGSGDCVAIGRGAAASSNASTGGSAIAVGRGAIAGSGGGGSGVAIGTAASAANINGIAVGAGATASGASAAIAIGSGATATVAFSTAIGIGTVTDFQGEVNLSQGAFAAGAVHVSLATLFMTTTDATPLELKTTNSTYQTVPTGVIVLTNNSTYIFDVDIVARKSTTGTDYSAWNLRFCINREANAASTALVGSVAKTLIGQTAGASTWDVGVTADTTNGRPTVAVTGQAATTIRWVGHARITKVAG